MEEVDRRANLAFSNQMEMLTFYLTDEQKYGINVFKIIEVVETPKEITKVPQTHPAIVGTFNFRGKVVTVIDLSFALAMPAVDWQNAISYIVVCEYSNTTQGFLVSRPNKLLNMSWNDIQKPGKVVQDAGYLTALAYDGEDSIQILDVEKVLGEVIGLNDTVTEAVVEEGRLVDTRDLKVLVLDDSKSARTMIHNALDQIGVPHALFEEGQLALDALQKSLQEGEKPFCLIISDIEMPGMDGFTFTRHVKADARLKSIHLVLHSSMSNQANHEKATAVGADGFIPKFQPDVIARVVLEKLAEAQAQGVCDDAA